MVTTVSGNSLIATRHKGTPALRTETVRGSIVAYPKDKATYVQQDVVAQTTEFAKVSGKTKRWVGKSTQVKTALSETKLIITGKNYYTNGTVRVYTNPDRTTLLAETSVHSGKFSLTIPLTRYQATVDRDGRPIPPTCVNAVFIDYVPDSLQKTSETEAQSLVSQRLMTDLTETAIDDLLAHVPLGDLKRENLYLKSYQDLVIKILDLVNTHHFSQNNLPTIGLVNYYYAAYNDPLSKNPFDPAHNKFSAEDAFLLAYMAHNNYDFSFYENLLLSTEERSQSEKDKNMLLLERVGRDTLWAMTETPDYPALCQKLEQIGVAPYEGASMDTVLRGDVRYRAIANLLIDSFDGNTVLKQFWNVPNIGNYADLFKNSPKYNAMKASLEEKMKVCFMEKFIWHQPRRHEIFTYDGNQVVLDINEVLGIVNIQGVTRSLSDL